MDRGAWWATVHRITELDTTEQLSTSYIINPKEYARRLLELIDELTWQTARHKIVIQILLYFYILTMWNPKMKLRKLFYAQKHDKEQNT